MTGQCLQSWCGACKRLGPHFAASNEILERSKNFVMINVQDDDDPHDSKYQPGSLRPRRGAASVRGVTTHSRHARRWRLRATHPVCGPEGKRAH